MLLVSVSSCSVQTESIDPLTSLMSSPKVCKRLVAVLLRVALIGCTEPCVRCRWHVPVIVLQHPVQAAHILGGHRTARGSVVAPELQLLAVVLFLQAVESCNDLVEEVGMQRSC